MVNRAKQNKQRSHDIFTLIMGSSVTADNLETTAVCHL